MRASTSSRLSARCLTRGTNPACEATSGPAVIATFFRKSATTPNTTNGSSATMPSARIAQRARWRAASVSAANIGMPNE